MKSSKLDSKQFQLIVLRMCVLCLCVCVCVFESERATEQVRVRPMHVCMQMLNVYACVSIYVCARAYLYIGPK